MFRLIFTLNLVACTAAKEDSGDGEEAETDLDSSTETATETGSETSTETATETSVDADGDGFNSDEDCDDDDASVYPGAEDIPGDGIDQDCEDGDAPISPWTGDGVVDFAFNLTGNHEGASLGLVSLNLGEEDLSFGGMVYSVSTLGGRVEVDAGHPAQEDLTPIDEDNPNVLAAFYTPVLYDDADGDGIHSEGEVIHGMASVWLTYFTESGSEGAWGAMDFSDPEESEDEPPPMADHMNIDLGGNLIGSEELMVGGTSTVGNEGVSNIPYSMAVLPSIYFEGGSTASILIDQEMVQGEPDTFEFTLSGAPDADHYSDLSGEPDAPPFAFAMEIATAYNDVDGDGFDSADLSVAFPVCSDNMMVLFMSLEQPTTFEVAFFYNMMGAQSGWTAHTEDPISEELVPVDSANIMSLEVSSTCEFP